MSKAFFRELLKPPAIRMAESFARVTGAAWIPGCGYFEVSPETYGGDYIHMIAGLYEDAERRTLREYFQPDDVIIEIGANIGVVSRCAIETKAKEGGHYICVEPNARSFAPLAANLADSNVPDGCQVSILNCAVGDPEHDGQPMDFHLKKTLSSGLCAVNTQTHQSGNEIITVPTRSLSSIVEDYAPSGYSLICDCEGGEILILQKDPEALKSCNQILIELHPTTLTGSDMSPERMVDVFQELGFYTHSRIRDTYYFNRQPSLS